MNEINKSFTYLDGNASPVACQSIKIRKLALRPLIKALLKIGSLAGVSNNSSSRALRPGIKVLSIRMALRPTNVINQNVKKR